MAKKGSGRKKKEKLGPNQVNLYRLDGKVKGKIELPPVFTVPVRTDLIRRAFTAFRANRRQPYGPSPTSGMRHAVSTWGKGRGVARVQRISGMRRGAQSPGTVGGRRAHPPKPEKNWSKKINTKERRMARNAALAACADPQLVAKRGHRFDSKLTLPVVVESGLEELLESIREEAKEREERPRFTREGIELLKRLGLHQDVQRATEGKRIRAGRGKMRGRRYRVPKSLLVVVSDAEQVAPLFNNLPGVDVTSPSGLNAEILAPGGDPGRLTLFSEKAMEEIRGWSS